MAYDEQFGRFIKELRLNHNWRIIDVAERLNVSINYISQLERGKRRATDKLIKKFSKLYGVNEVVLYQISGRLPEDFVKRMLQTPRLLTLFYHLNECDISHKEIIELENNLVEVITTFVSKYKK